MSAIFWRVQARNKWPGCEILGVGRFALKSFSGEVYLWPTREEAENWTLFYDSAVFDLMPTPVPNIKDDWEDRQRERREARENRA